MNIKNKSEWVLISFMLCGWAAGFSSTINLFLLQISSTFHFITRFFRDGVEERLIFGRRVLTLT